jgi:hypothetical protein
MGIACQLWLAVREMLMRKNRMLLLWKRKLLLVFSSPSFFEWSIQRPALFGDQSDRHPSPHRV